MSRIKGLLTELEMERRSCVQHNLKPRLLHDLIKSIELGNIGNDDHLEVAAAGLVGVGFTDLLRLVLGPDGGDDGVALGEQLLENVGCSCSVKSLASTIAFHIVTFVSLSLRP